MYAYRKKRWLAAIFRMAVNDDLIRRTPCFGIKLPAKTEAKVEPLRREEVEPLLDALPERYRALAGVGVGAGLRQGEAPASPSPTSTSSGAGRSGSGSS